MEKYGPNELKKCITEDFEQFTDDEVSGLIKQEDVERYIKNIELDEVDDFLMDVKKVLIVLIP